MKVRRRRFYFPPGVVSPWPGPRVRKTTTSHGVWFKMKMKLINHPQFQG